MIAKLGNVKRLQKDIKKIVNGRLKALSERPIVFAEDCSALCTLEFGVRYAEEALWKLLELDRVVRLRWSPGVLSWTISYGYDTSYVATLWWPSGKRRVSKGI